MTASSSGATQFGCLGRSGDAGTRGAFAGADQRQVWMLAQIEATLAHLLAGRGDPAAQCTSLPIGW